MTTENMNVYALYDYIMFFYEKVIWSSMDFNS